MNTTWTDERLNVSHVLVRFNHTFHHETYAAVAANISAVRASESAKAMAKTVENVIATKMRVSRFRMQYRVMTATEGMSVETRTAMTRDAALYVSSFHSTNPASS